MATSDGPKDDRSMSWYNDDIKEVPDDIRHLLEGYSGLPSQDVVSHVLNLRSKAFQICPYPCIGQFKFLILTLKTHPLYSHIVERLKKGDTLLDLGCCFGQDIRQLVADGIPSERIYGLDIEGPLIDAGFDLFQDRGKLKSTFIVEDVYNPEADWHSLESTIDVIHASAFFHLFPWSEQSKAGCILARLARPKGIIVGRQMGSLTPGEFPSLNEGTTGYRHDIHTLQTLWDEIGANTGTQWTVDGTMDMVGVMGKGDSSKDSKSRPAWAEPNMRRLLFTIQKM